MCHQFTALLVSEHSTAKLECKGGRSVCVCERVHTTTPRDRLSTICSDKLRNHLFTAHPVATCMDAGDDLQLNLAGFEQPASNPKAQPRSNRHTVSFKKQQKVLACPLCTLLADGFVCCTVRLFAYGQCDTLTAETEASSKSRTAASNPQRPE